MLITDMVHARDVTRSLIDKKVGVLRMSLILSRQKMHIIQKNY